MSKKLILALALFAAGAHAQQSVDINADEFTSGRGDAKLAALAKQAAAEGRRVVVTAPKEWHKSIAAKLGKGDNVVLREGFYESVLARVEDKPEPPKPAKPEPEKAPAVAAAPVRAPEPKPAPAAEPKPVAPVAVPAPAVAAAAPAPAPQPAVSKPAQPLVALPASQPKAAQPASAVDEDTIRDRLSQSLIEGRAAQGALAVGSLQSGDVIYVDDPVRGVVRREGTKAVLYWLDGDLDLRRTELKPLAPNRYQVMGRISGEGSLRREFDESAAELVAAVPADGAAERSRLEQAYNGGRNIRDRLSTAQLAAGDVVYAGDGAAVIVRREGKDLQRYWLEGSLDLRQSGVRADGQNKYRIVGNLAR
ncbi:hypothetical protein [Dokdonella sp.]|uniref:hypothetical protein n=1 Tax=Dokdonella sp. TaxID=2291710 RepID=UPI0026140887|nr:hypothetical protein [Dokdonella sp.]